MKEDENGSWTEKRFTSGEKGTGKVGCDTLVTSDSVSENTKLDDRVGISLGDSNSDFVKLAEDLEGAAKDKHGIIMETGVRTRGRLSKEEKRKMKLGVEDSSSNCILSGEFKLENVNGIVSLVPSIQQPMKHCAMEFKEGILMWLQVMQEGIIETGSEILPGEMHLNLPIVLPMGNWVIVLLMLLEEKLHCAKQVVE
ncbi:hypothetical protein CDL12_15200 [Handroanthus impetiginosus]|uniref:Uncharacterized protein n=1 Tax=Handroanthus impetiginosus TaxID=429701 RepID=A0A2G9H3V1_9LAMI|nr:hypothetical protein CDL12_15200 [Handroanthus impetiginosus]